MSLSDSNWIEEKKSEVGRWLRRDRMRDNKRTWDTRQDTLCVLGWIGGVKLGWDGNVENEMRMER